MRTRWLFLSLMAIGFFLVFVQAGAPSLDSDGIHYAAVAKEIALSGRWLLPYDPIMETNYYWHLHLSLWPTALIFKLVGISTAAAKLYSMGMTLLALGGIFLLGRILVSPWAGWCSGMAFLATDHVLRIARQCRVDLPLVAWIVWATVGLMLAQTGSRAWYLLAGIASLGAVMTKEVVGLVPLCTGLAYLLLRRRWRDLIHPAWLAAWGIAILPPLLISWAEQALFQSTLWRGYYLQNFSFLATASHLTQPWWYYAWAIWDKYGYLLPFALAGGWLALRQIASGKEPRWLLVFLWAAAFPLGFSLVSHKVHYYILPTYAAGALLIGLAAQRWITGRWPLRVVRAVVTLAVIAALAMVLFPIRVHKTRYEPSLRIVPRVDEILRKAPGELIVIRQDVASLVFYSTVIRRVISAHHFDKIQDVLAAAAGHRRYCLVAEKDWAEVDPKIRSRWAQRFREEERLFLEEEASSDP